MNSDLSNSLGKIIRQQTQMLMLIQSGRSGSVVECLTRDLRFAGGAQWLSGRVLDSRPKGREFEPHRRHCVVVLEQDTFILA